MPDDFDRLYGEIASFMSGPGAGVPGITETQLLGNVGHSRLVIVARFRSYADWVHAQWDVRVGELLEELAANCQTLEFDLYFCDRFPLREAGAELRRSRGLDS